MSEVSWCEIGDRVSTERFETLSAHLKEKGVANQFKFVPLGSDPEKTFVEARACAQVRLSGSACSSVLKVSDRLPADVLMLKAADSIVTETDGTRWPRCFFVEAVNRTLSTVNLDLDFAGGVFVLGATPETRWTVSSLVRIGYSKVTLCDPDEALGLTMVEELRRSLFGVQVQHVPRHLITQLPSVHAIAVNTLVEGRDDGALSELFYFNFLKPGGAWLDLAFSPFNSALESEAKSVGATIVFGPRVYAVADCLWANEVFRNTHVDADELSTAYARATGRVESGSTA